MSVVDRSADFTRKRYEEEARERSRRWDEHLEQETRAGKCCATLETGHDPDHDFHLCLRKKGHKGYHMDKITGLSWKWDAGPEEPTRQ